MRKTTAAVSVANAKRAFSDLLGRVAYGGETILITRRGRPMAMLAPVEPGEREPLGSWKRGFLDNDDPFFEIIEEVVAARARHKPRVLARSRTGKSKKGTRRRAARQDR
jgi:prevent-host-death family protein